MQTLKASCTHIMRTLGTGHREAVYHAALIASLNKAQVFHRSEVVCAITYLGQTIGFGRADLVIDDLVVELKAASKAPEQASGQLRKYIESLTKSESQPFRGVVINFNQKTGKVDIYEETVREQSLPVSRPTRLLSSVFQRSLKPPPRLANCTLFKKERGHRHF